MSHVDKHTRTVTCERCGHNQTFSGDDYEIVYDMHRTSGLWHEVPLPQAGRIEMCSRCYKSLQKWFTPQIDEAQKGSAP